MVVPSIMCEGNPDPVEDGDTIRFGSSVGNVPSEMAPRLDRHEVQLKEHYHVGGREVNFLPDSDVVHNCVFSGKWSQQLHLGVDGQGCINSLRHWDVEGSADLTQAQDEPVCASDCATGQHALGGEGGIVL